MQSSKVNAIALEFQYLAPFQTDRGSKMSGVKNPGQISPPLYSNRIRVGIGNMCR